MLDGVCDLAVVEEASDHEVGDDRFVMQERTVQSTLISVTVGLSAAVLIGLVETG